MQVANLIICMVILSLNIKIIIGNKSNIDN